MKSITIDAIRPLGSGGKLAEVSYTCDGKQGKAKAWANDVEQGKTLEVDFEQKDNTYNGNTTKETWIKVPKAGGKGGGYGGGGGKADPAKLEIEKQRLDLEKEKQGRFDEKWTKDRQAEAHRQASIQAQVIVKAAVDLAIAAQKPEPSIVNGFALDLAETLRQTHAALYNSFALAADDGGGR